MRNYCRDCVRPINSKTSAEIRCDWCEINHQFRTRPIENLEDLLFMVRALRDRIISLENLENLTK